MRDGCTYLCGGRSSSGYDYLCRSLLLIVVAYDQVHTPVRWGGV